MKNLIISLIFISTIACKAQMPLTEMYTNTVNGEYYKDVNEDLNKLSGICIYSDGNENLVINFDL